MAEQSPVLTRSLSPSPDWLACVYDAGRWRLLFMPELGEAWWCVPGSRRLGASVVVGVA